MPTTDEHLYNILSGKKGFGDPRLKKGIVLKRSQEPRRGLGVEFLRFKSRLRDPEELELYTNFSKWDIISELEVALNADRDEFVQFHSFPKLGLVKLLVLARRLKEKVK